MLRFLQGLRRNVVVFWGQALTEDEEKLHRDLVGIAEEGELNARKQFEASKPL